MHLHIYEHIYMNIYRESGEGGRKRERRKEIYFENHNNSYGDLLKAISIFNHEENIVMLK